MPDSFAVAPTSPFTAFVRFSRVPCFATQSSSHWLPRPRWRLPITAGAASTSKADLSGRRGERSEVAKNPHAEVKLEVNGASAPAALPRFAVPKQSAAVDAVTVLGSSEAARAQGQGLGNRICADRQNGCLKVVAPKVGDRMAVVGSPFKDEKGEAILRVEFLIGNGTVTPLRSPPM